MSIEKLVALLHDHLYAECRVAAAELIRQGNLLEQERAQAFLVLSRCLAALHSLQDALGPAELAVHFSRECGEYDLLGRALSHLAELCHDNRLYKRAATCLDEYFQYFTLYDLGKRLEGQVLLQKANSLQAMGRGSQALDYFRKAYRWHATHGTEAQTVDVCRAEMLWQQLKLGRLEGTEELVAQSEAFLRQAPNDLDARARCWNSVAYRHYLRGEYALATETANRVLNIRGVAPLRKAHACLTLHHTARAMGLARDALGMGILARIQANLARRPELEEEATRSMLHMQHQDGLPMLEELLRSHGQAGSRHTG